MKADKFGETCHFLIETITMLVNVEEVRANMLSTFMDGMEGFPGPPERKQWLIDNFVSSIADKEHFWLLVYANTFAIAMAEVYRIDLQYVIDGLLNSMNHHYARVYHEDLKKAKPVRSDENDEDDEDLRRKYGLDRG